MKVYLIFVFLLAAPALVRLVTNETPSASSAEVPAESATLSETPAAKESPAPSAAQAPAVAPAPASTPAKSAASEKKPARNDCAVGPSVPPAHAYNFM